MQIFYFLWMNVWFILLFNILMCVCVCVFLNNVESCDSRSDHTIHDSIYLTQSYIGFQFWQPCSKVPTQLGFVWFVFFYHSIFITHFPLLITHHSFTHHSLLITLNTTPVWHHHSIFFTLFVGLIPVTHCRFFFFTRKNTHRTYWEKKKKRNPEQTEVKERRKKKRKKNEPRTDRSERKKKKKKKEKEKEKETQNRSKWKKEEKEEKKKKNPKQPTRRRKEKKSQKWSKVTAEYYLWVPYVCLITKLPLSYELWKLKTPQSYRLPNNLFVMGPIIFEL